MSKEELLEHGVNVSSTHVDFMIGTDDIDITGITPDGREVVIFQNGQWSSGIVPDRGTMPPAGR